MDEPIKVVDTKIRDCIILQPSIHYDYRGEYFETFHKDIYKALCPSEFVVDDISVSRKNTLRGLHGDEKTWKLIQCLFGEIFEVVVDLRKNSPTYLNWQGFALNDKNRYQLLIPAGCINGHLCLSDMCLFSYKQTEYYTGAENQLSIKWDDPLLNIHWPINNPILSDRDNTAKYLND